MRVPRKSFGTSRPPRSSASVRAPRLTKSSAPCIGACNWAASNLAASELVQLRRVAGQDPGLLSFRHIEFAKATRDVVPATRPRRAGLGEVRLPHQVGYADIGANAEASLVVTASQVTLT